MIGYIKGKILEHADGQMLVATGTEAATVGYSIKVPANPSYLGFVPGGLVELYIYTHLRQDALDLFGFASKAEKDLFITLLAVDGIGPKAALGVLSGAEFSALIQAILEGDKEFLRGLPGVGKKTTERIVLELKDPIRKKIEAGVFGGVAHTGIPRGQLAQLARASMGENGLMRDAKTALVGLGYREPDAAQMVKAAYAEFDGEQPAPKVEDLIRSALQQAF